MPLRIATQLSLLRSSLRQRWWELAPPPAYLRLPAVGIDLADHSLKYATLTLAGTSPRIVHWGLRTSDVPFLQGGLVADQRALVEALRKVALRTGRQFARLSVEEEKAFLFRVAVAPPRSHEELRAAVEFQLQENVPLDPQEVVFDVVPAGIADDLLLADVAAYPRSLVEQLSKLCEEAGLIPLSFEVEGAAIARAVLPWRMEGSVLLLDFGATEAGLFIVERGHLLFSAKLPWGGDHFTESIATAAGIQRKEVEALKATHNFYAPTQPDHLVAAAQAVQELTARIAQELNRHLTYWQEHPPTAGVPHAPVKEVVGVGGSMLMPGLIDALGSHLNLPSRIGNVWLHFPPPSCWVPPIPARYAPRFATAVGLVLREALPALAPLSYWR